MKYSMVAVGAMAAVVAAQVEVPEFAECGRTCANNMLSASKAAELGCDANDYRCLCQNQDFIYGLRDCSTEACDNGETPPRVVDFGVEVCSRAGVAVNPTGTEPTVTGTNALATETGSAGDSVETIYTTWTDGATAIVSAVTTSTADSEDGGAGGAIVTTFTSDGTEVVSTITEGGAIQSSVSDALSSVSDALSSVGDQISSGLASLSTMTNTRSGDATTTTTANDSEGTDGSDGNDGDGGNDGNDGNDGEGDDGSAAPQLAAAPMLMAFAGLVALLI